MTDRVEADARGGPSAILDVRVVPRAGRSEIAGERGGAVLIRLAAAPVEGKANEALIALLAQALGVPRRNIQIVSGERSRQKRVAIAGVTVDIVRSRLLGIG